MRRSLNVLLVGVMVLSLSVSAAGASGNPRPVNVDGFEDGDTQTILDSAWNGWQYTATDTSSAEFAAQSNTVYSGGQAALLSSESTSRINATRDSPRQINRLSARIRVDQRYQSARTNYVALQLRSANNDGLAAVRFDQSGDITTQSGQTVGQWSTAQWYNVTVANIDYTAEEYDILIDGTVISQNQQFATALSTAGDPQEIAIENTGGYDGTVLQPVDAYIDDVSTDVELASSTPSFDNSSASPSGSLSEEPGSLSINVSDGDFPNDKVDVTAYQDGSLIGTKTINSNQTVDFGVNPSAGEHSYYFEAVDRYGNTATSATQTYQVPDELVVKSETEPSKIIDQTTTTVRVYNPDGGEQSVYERTTTNGRLNLTGLPPNQPLVVSANADGYRPRRIFISSLYKQQNIYLLNESETATTTTFVISDYTGSYPRDTSVLEVQRSINGNYTTVLGDYFGANGEFSAQLDYNVRHRLILRNTETGQSQVLGGFTPLSSGDESVDVFASGQIDVQRTNPLIAVSPSTSAVPAVANQTVTTTVRDRGTGIQSATVEIYHEGSNGQLTLLADGSLTGPGELSRDVNLTGYGSDTLVVKTSFTTDGGQQSVTYKNLSIRTQMNNQYSLLSTLTGMSGLIPGGGLDAFQNAVAILTSIIAAAGAASQIRMSGEGFALIAVGVLAGWAVIGWVGYGLVFATGVGTGALVFFRRGV